jgi:hypothetical protein
MQTSGLIEQDSRKSGLNLKSIDDKATTAHALAERANNDATRDAVAARGGLCADLGSDRVNWSSSDSILAERNV